MILLLCNGLDHQMARTNYTCLPQAIYFTWRGTATVPTYGAYFEVSTGRWRIIKTGVIRISLACHASITGCVQDKMEMQKLESAESQCQSKVGNCFQTQIQWKLKCTKSSPDFSITLKHEWDFFLQQKWLGAKLWEMQSNKCNNWFGKLLWNICNFYYTLKKPLASKSETLVKLFSSLSLYYI